MTLAAVGAFALRDFDEGAAVMLFYQVGELFQSIAVERSRRSVASLMDLRPDVALLLRDGEVEECDPEDVQVGDLLRVLPGQRIPVDGVVVGREFFCGYGENYRRIRSCRRGAGRPDSLRLH